MPTKRRSSKRKGKGKKPSVLAKVRKEVMKAYADANMRGEKGYELRSLQFKASAPLSVKDAKQVLSEAIPEGYNEFDAYLLDLLPPDAQVVIAREYSVALYVYYAGKLPSGQVMKADERHEEPDGSVRYWWD